MTHHVIFGDVGGHWAPFKGGLKSVGVDMKTMNIPEGMVIVQLGDLVHRGPNSALVVRKVDELMNANPGQWVQLAGNHELPYVINARRFYAELVDAETLRILQRWHGEGLLRTAYSFQDSSGEGYVVSHAGLTAQFVWQFMGARSNGDVLGKAPTLTLEECYEWERVNPGVMLGKPANRATGPFWAEAVNELYRSWLETGVDPGFHQIHGHSTPYVWDRDRYRFNYADWVTGPMVLDKDKRHTSFTVANSRFYGIDVGLEKIATIDTIHPLVVE